MSQHARLTRRIVGLLSARLPDLELQQVPDSRDPRWVSWPLVTVLRALITCLAASCTGLREAEELTEQMSSPIRRKLGIRGRIPDTTMRTIAAGLEPDDVRQRMHQQIRAAARRKALVPDGLPFNVAMLDGKSTALPSCDDHFAQRQSNDSRLIGLLRTMTCSLVTTAAQPCLDAMPIPAATNEMGHFRYCLDQLLAAYRALDRHISPAQGRSRDRVRLFSSARGRTRGFGPPYFTSARKIEGSSPSLLISSRKNEDFGPPQFTSARKIEGSRPLLLISSRKNEVSIE